MNIRRFRALHTAGASYAEIARECGVEWRTVKKYLAEDAPSVPPTGTPRVGTQRTVIGPFMELVEAWLRNDIALKGTVIHERLVAEHGFTGSYQRVKMFLAEARGRIAAELAETDENPLTGLHRRFEVVAGAQAQVDWGDEGDLLGHVGISAVYSFHMTLSYSRDPFSCFTTSMDLATFWDCHRRGFAGHGTGAVRHRKTLREITHDDFDALTAAGQARQDSTGRTWKHYRACATATKTVLFHHGVLPQLPPSWEQRWPFARRLAGVPEPMHSILVRYLDRKSVTCKPATVSSLATRLAHFGTVISTIDPHATPANLDRVTHIEPWMIALSRAENTKSGGVLSVAEQARRILAVANFCSDITEWDWPEAPSRKLLYAADNPRLPQPLSRFLPPAADQALTQALLDSPNRLAADALLLQRACGLRIGELLDLELDAVIDVPGAGSWLKVPLGKLDTERMVPIDTETLTLIDRISTTRSPGRPIPHPRTGRPADFLFTAHGHRLSQNRLRKELDRAAAATGLGHITPHQLRHTYATALVNAGVSLQALMVILGHVSAEMSLRYARLFDATIRAEYERALTLAKSRLGPLPTPDRDTVEPDQANDWRTTPTIKTALAGGYCLRAPAQGPCAYANLCEHCPAYRTTSEHVPSLTRQRDDAAALAQDATDRGWDSETERHLRLMTRLNTHIEQAATRRNSA